MQFPRFLRQVVITVGLIAALAAAGFVAWLHQPVTLLSSVVEFRIPPGSPLKGIISLMNRAGVGVQPDLMRLLIQGAGSAGHIKAGTYAVREGMTPQNVLQMLENGEVIRVELRIPEGWRFTQWREYLGQHPGLEHLLPHLSDQDVLQVIGAKETEIEGVFFPDTYRVDKYASDIEFLRLAYKRLQDRLAAAWEGRVAGLPYKSPYEALVMASIIEKETGHPDDRKRISAVFVNRLRAGMRLQTDPTVIYGLGDTFDGNLRKRDLLTDRAFNTYTRYGLPPTPIAMPGQASLEAALHPAEEEIYYFVARGDGSSEFSRTLTEHNAAVARYQLRH